MPEQRGPNFVCIGAQKAGTTWLYKNLESNHDVWLTPVKELHYFDRVRANEALLGEWGMPHPEGVYNRYIKDQFPPSLKNMRWLRRYYRYGLDKQWYLGLFEEQFTGGQTCGDITPAYSTLDDSGVRYAQKVLGQDTAIIFIIRNPVERSWSAAKMMFRDQDKSYERDNYAEITALLKKPLTVLRSDYANIIRRWQDHFQHVHVMTYDALCESPDGFLGDISRHLKIRNQWDRETINKRVWSDEKSSPVPDGIASLLRAQYQEQTEELYSLTGLPEVKQWLSDMSADQTT